MPTIASGRMHFPFASEAQYGSRYRSISFSRIASNNKLISYKSRDKLLRDLAGFGLAGNYHKFFLLLDYEGVGYDSSRNDLLRLDICECLFEAYYIRLHLVCYDQL